ncbi:MAG: hypothetical protein R2854_23110 [Caldilineaceae bacterium]
MKSAARTKDNRVLERDRAPAHRGRREVLDVGELDLADGLVGDNWRARGSSATSDGSAHPEMQLNIMNVRSTMLVAQSKERWPLAGDQLYVDMDLSEANLPPGTQLAIGDAVVEITPIPHNGCKKFVARFGLGRDEIRQLARGQRTPPARHQCQGRPAGDHSGGRRGAEDLKRDDVMRET